MPMSVRAQTLHASIGVLLLAVASVSPAQNVAPAQNAAPPQNGAQTPQGQPKRSIEKLTDDMYRATDNAHSTVFLVTKDGIVLADPINRGFAEWLKPQLAQRFGVPVKYVLYSHHHFDHASGGEVFADTAKLVGQRNMLKYLAMPPVSTKMDKIVGEFQDAAELDTNHDNFVDKDEAARGHMSDALFNLYDANHDGRLSAAEVARGPVSDVWRPDITYNKDWDLNFGGHHIHMTWMGEMNHANDMSLITFTDESVAYVCDYDDIRRLPYKTLDWANGKLNEWIAADKRTEAITANYKYVSPCHGPVGTAADLAIWRGSLEDLRGQVAAGLARGESLQQLQASIKEEKYADWSGYTTPHWVEQNVEGMYHFLTDGKPGAQSDAKAKAQ
jgi:glyoxylase-like metal-dependent hydrolase (beta-lactamase superfamily II)